MNCEKSAWPILVHCLVAPCCSILQCFNVCTRRATSCRFGNHSNQGWEMRICGWWVAQMALVHSFLLLPLPSSRAVWQGAISQGTSPSKFYKPEPGEIEEVRHNNLSTDVNSISWLEFIVNVLISQSEHVARWTVCDTRYKITAKIKQGTTSSKLRLQVVQADPDDKKKILGQYRKWRYEARENEDWVPEKIEPVKQSRVLPCRDEMSLCEVMLAFDRSSAALAVGYG